MPTKNKFACDCGKMAQWVYMPGFSSKENSYFCDDCVHRGCTCNHNLFPGIEIHDEIDIGENPDKNSNWKKIDEKSWTPLDDKNREYPCIEYFFERDGFDAEEDHTKEYEKNNIQYKLCSVD